MDDEMRELLWDLRFEMLFLKVAAREQASKAEYPAIQKAWEKRGRVAEALIKRIDALEDL